MVFKIELEIISDILAHSGIGKRKIVTKADKIKHIFSLDEIEVEEWIDQKTGKHIRKYASVYKGDIQYKVNTPYEELKKIVLNESTPILGLASKSKNYK